MKNFSNISFKKKLIPKGKKFSREENFAVFAEMSEFVRRNNKKARQKYQKGKKSGHPRN